MHEYFLCYNPKHPPIILLRGISKCSKLINSKTLKLHLFTQTQKGDLVLLVLPLFFLIEYCFELFHFPPTSTNTSFPPSLMIFTAYYLCLCIDFGWTQWLDSGNGMQKSIRMSIQRLGYKKTRSSISPLWILLSNGSFAPEDMATVIWVMLWRSLGGKKPVSTANNQQGPELCQ